MKIIASIQVRMGSSRFPGKAMHPVAGKPLLGHLIDRLLLAKRLDGIIIATTTRSENDVIEAYCLDQCVPCFRGSEDDVLDRTLKALQSMDATVGVEVYGDCPLIDPAIVDDMIEIFLSDPADPDFVGNDIKTTYPPGMEVEVFKVSALADADRRIQDMSIREHGTLFIRQNPTIYRIRNVEAPPDYHLPEIELEIDTEEDLFIISAVIEYFNGRADFTLKEIIAFLNTRPDLVDSNRNIHRRWKEFRDEHNA